MKSGTQSMGDEKAMCDKRIAGLTQHASLLPNGLTINGQTYTVAQIQQQYTSRLGVVDGVSAADTALKTAQAARSGGESAFRSFDASVVSQLKGALGKGNAALADFDVTVANPPTRTVAQKTQAVELAKATRKARNTMGSKQKAAIHGVLPAATTADPAASGSNGSSSGSNGSTPAATGH